MSNSAECLVRLVGLFLALALSSSQVLFPAESRWEKVFTVSSHSGVRSLTVDGGDPQIVYATDGSAVFRSTNGGQSFSNWPIVGIPRGIEEISADPAIRGTVYGIGWDGVFKSSDAGKEWMLIWREEPEYIDGTPFPFSLARSILIDPTNSSILYMSRGFACSGSECIGGNIFKSVDGGITWRVLSLHGRTVRLTASPAEPETLYGAGGVPRVTSGLTEAGLYKSEDSGESWRMLFPGDTTIRALAVDPFNSDVVYTASPYRFWTLIYKSRDGGLTWQWLPTGFEGSWLRIEALLVDSSDSEIIYAATSAGVIRSANGGVSWSLLTSDLSENCFFSVLATAASSSFVYAGARCTTPDGVQEAAIFRFEKRYRRRPIRR